MDAIKLVAIFALIIILIKIKKTLSFSIFCGAIATSILYNVGFIKTINVTFKSITSWSTISILLIFYMITFLQRMLEKRGHLDLAQKSLNGLFNNRRINASIASFFIGLLPSAGAVFICGSMVDSACGDYLTREEKTFVTSYYRHIPESFMPTYTTIILGTQLSGVPVSSFIIAMIPVVLFLFVLGYLFYLRKIPKETGQEKSASRSKDLLNLILSLWTIALTIILILVFNLPVYTATLISIVLSIFINKFKFKELKPMFISAFEYKIMTSSIVVMIFKDIITATGVIETLPGMFQKLPIPTPIVFALIFFFGTIISGATAMVALCLPLALAAIPNGGLPLMVLLMSISYAAMQISPTHICLTLVVEYFKTSMVDLLKRTTPVISTFCVFVIGYYLLLNFWFY